MVPGWFFMVPGWFFMFLLWLQVWFSWCQVDLYRHEWSQVGLFPSWAKCDVKNTQKLLTLSVSWPHDPARPCRPKAGFGLVIMMMAVVEKISEDHLVAVKPFLCLLICRRHRDWGRSQINESVDRPCRLHHLMHRPKFYIIAEITDTITDSAILWQPL